MHWQHIFFRFLKLCICFLKVLCCSLASIKLSLPLAFSFQITSVHSSRALDVQFMDTGTVASVKVSELRDIPSQFLREIITLPPQVQTSFLSKADGLYTSLGHVLVLIILDVCSAAICGLKTF